MPRTPLSRRLPLACLLLAACATTGGDREDPRSVVHRFVDAVNAHDFAAVEHVLTPGFTRHSQATPDVQVRSRDDMLRFLQANAVTFPDEKVTLEWTVAEGDRVAFHGTYSGTHEGQMGPYTATHRTMEIDVSGTFRVEGDRIAELWILWDNMSLLGQLGLLPPPGPPPED